MAAADQIKRLIKFYGEGDEDRFFASAMQIAASEARQGHANFAQELKELIEKARKERSSAQFEKGKVIPFSKSKNEIRELVDVVNSNLHLTDMTLTESLRDSLSKFIHEQKHWEVLNQYNLKPKRKLLFYGPPGCGKTMTAHALAGELGIPAFIVRLDGIISKYMGESIAKLRLIFDTMVDHRGVYLFDEFDSIGAHRNQGQDVGEIKRVLNSFLVNIENNRSNSVIIAATNLPKSLDNALFRRFDEIIQFPLPNGKEIIQTIENRLSGFTLDKNLDNTSILEEAEGLNFSELVNASEEAIKEMILSQRNSIKYLDLITALRKRKESHANRLQ